MADGACAEAGGLRRSLVELPDGATYRIRPLDDGDEAAIADFLKHIDQDDIRLRFFYTVRTFDHQFLWPLVHYDHRQAIAYVAFDPETSAVAGVSRLHCDVFRTFGEFAILVRSDLKRHGLGRLLMAMLIDWARDREIPVIHGDVLRENTPMLTLCRQLGFCVRNSHDDPGVMNVELAVEKRDSTPG